MNSPWLFKPNMNISKHFQKYFALQIGFKMFLSGATIQEITVVLIRYNSHFVI